VDGKEDFSFLHPVQFTPHSLAAHATGTATGAMLATNSFHHQAIHPDRIGKYLIASAWSADGIIEAIEPAPGSPWAASNRFVLGLQWHPERMQDEAPHRQPFLALVKATATNRVSAL
jgi:putative glutamine amidotransferase